MTNARTKRRSSATKLTPILVVDDVDRAAAFYAELLGFEVETRVAREGGASFAILTSGELELMLQSRGSVREEHPEADDPRGFRAVLYLDVDDIETIHRRAMARAVVVTEIRRAPHGQRECYARDPDGNLIGLAE